MITALLVVSLATIAAASLAVHQALDIRRTGNLIDSEQAWLYGKGGEAWAKVILVRDRKDNNFDHAGEDWSGSLPPIELPGGFIVGGIEDLQGRFNLNNLIQGDKVNKQQLARFQRLLDMLELEPKIATAVVDWLDPDINALPPDGAEDDYYSGLESPYRTSNSKMVSISELRLVKGFDQETYTKIAPFVTTLPTATPININTAPAEILASLSDKINLQMATELVAERDKDKTTKSPTKPNAKNRGNPFKDLKAFSGHEVLKTAKVSQKDLNNIGVASDYFVVRSETRIGRGRAALESLIHRSEGGNIRVIHRQRIENVDKPVSKPQNSAEEREAK